MADSLLDQLRARGEAFFTEVSNNLLSNPTFIEMLKKGIAAKESVEKQVGEAMRNMNVATRRDLAKLETRLSELEAELESTRAARAKAPAARAAARTKARKAAPRRKAARK